MGSAPYVLAHGTDPHDVPAQTPRVRYMERPPLNPGTGTGSAADRVGLRLWRLSELVRYAQDTLRLDAEDAEVFMALHAVVLNGVECRAPVDPALRRIAESAVAQAAGAVPGKQREMAVELLLTVWCAGPLPCVAARIWAVRSPDLPLKCLRAAATGD